MSDRYKIDSHKLMYHPERVAKIKAVDKKWENAQNIYPIYIELSPVGACNHRCTFCAVDYVGYQPIRLKQDVIKERFLEFSKLGVKSVNFAGEGEPMLHKQISEMIYSAKCSGLDVSMTTNASVLPKDFLNKGLPSLSWLKVSLNAGSRETYAKIHRTASSDFDKANEHLRLMVDRRNSKGLDCTLGVQTLLLPDNADEMEDLALRCRDDLGVDYLVVKPYSQHLSSNNLIYSDIDYSKWLGLGEKLQKYDTADFNVIFRSHTMKKYMATEHSYEKCYSTPFVWAHVMADGTVSGCSAYLLNEVFEFGNIYEQTFEEIWTGDKRRQNFEFVSNDLDISDCRKNCRMDECNRYLFELIDEQPAHVNFI